MQQVYPEQALLKELLLCPKLKSAINNQGKMPKTVWHVEDEFKSLTAWRKKLPCSLVVWQQILHPEQAVMLAQGQNIQQPTIHFYVDEDSQLAMSW